MAKFPIIEYEQLSDSNVKAIYEEIQVELGFGIVPNLFKSMAINPRILEANWKKFRSTILKGDVPRTLKEMLGIAISQANSSPYALNVHLHGLSSLGMSEEVLRTLVSDFAACPLPEREKAVIGFGLKAATEPHALTSKDYQHLYDLGLDDSEIFEIVATADLFTSVNKYTDSISLEIDTL
ncbi:carboxymuconolactone decarboxylase family protein [Brasilonema bromeliae]|uniref:Carboxymuconolactone decarboxylase n=1 Tax=Brasilonema bromeliae SPC951 TaxID=385972 RepID=A0ABX1P273_9CYAN|nr:carboxymuconolactone decarboxylase family protein [Brasilonema bromeliae]NMG18426.1 carboxymuconolactone decarboxylase [Brasilonema bromeliae SPC951]